MNVVLTTLTGPYPRRATARVVMKSDGALLLGRPCNSACRWHAAGCTTSSACHLEPAGAHLYSSSNTAMAFKDPDPMVA